MKTLAEYRGDEALALTADIMEPLAIALADEEVQALAKAKAPLIKYVKPMLKNHPEEIINILARVADVPVDEYRNQINVLTLPVQLLSFISDPMVKELFTSQGQKMDSLFSGPAMEESNE